MGKSAETTISRINPQIFLILERSEGAYEESMFKIEWELKA